MKFSATKSICLVMLMTAWACRESKFTGKSGGASPSPTVVPQVQPIQPQSVGDGSPSTAGNPSGDQGSSTPVTILDGSGSLKPDYGACATLPSAGKMKYPAKCSENQVMVVINDGTAQEMTCCPINGTNVFSSLPNEKFQERAGHCLADEVGVGMVSSATSAIYCSKINTQFLKLGAPQKSTYVSGKSGLAPELVAIAKSYNVSDTCICPAKSILAGGHTPQDNTCTDECVEILQK